MKKPLFLSLLLTVCCHSYAATNSLELTRVVQKSLQYPASACVITNGSFNSKFDNSKISVYENGLKQNIEITASTSELCLNSLNHGSQYKIAITKGLKDKNGLELRENKEFTFDFPDAKEKILKPKGMILPPDGEQTALNIETINIKKLYLDIYALGLNNLDDVSFYELLEPNYNVEYLIGSNASLLKTIHTDTEFKINKKIKTSFSLKDTLKLKSGIYIIRAHNNKEGSDLEQSYFSLIISDLAISSFYGQENLGALVKSFTKGTPLEKVKVELRARNNDILETAVTDKNGFAAFKGRYPQGRPHAHTPSYIIASLEHDIYAQSLNAGELFLNEQHFRRDGDLRVLSYSDRGIYRPGETLYGTVIIRDKTFKAHSENKLVIKVLNPRGLEVQRFVKESSAPGAFEFEYTFKNKIRRGSYRFDLSFDGKNSIGSIFVSVDDFIPPNIEIKDKEPKDSIKPESQKTLQLKADFLYGKAAPDLRYQVSSFLSYDAKGIKGFEDYIFGEDETQSAHGFQDGLTTKDGIIDYAYKYADTSYPALLTVTADVFDTAGQRVVFNRSYRLETGKTYVGAAFNDRGSDKVADLVNVKQDGSFEPEEIEYTLERVKSYYHYIFVNSRWEFREVVSKSYVTGGSLLIKNDKENPELSFTLDDGLYLLTISDKDTGKILYKREFYKGYNASSDDGRQHLLEISTDKQNYTTNDDITIGFDSAFDGYASVLLASDRVLDIKTIKIKKGYNTVKLKTPDKASTDIYAMVHATAKLSEGTYKISRAAGIVHIPFDFSDKVISINTDLKEDLIAKPLETLRFNVTLDNCQEGYLSAMLVDDAILQLTDYKAPDIVKTMLEPQAFYYDIFDRYAYIMPDRTSSNQGYGDEGQNLASLSAIPFKITALHNNIVKIKDSKAVVEFKIPQFSGALRLMLTAFDKDNFGSSQKRIKIRDNTVVTPSLPRFLSVKDSSYLKLDIANIDNSESDYDIDIKCRRGLQCSFNKKAHIQQGRTSQYLVDIKALEKATGQIDIHVSSQDFNYKETLKLAIRPSYPEIIESKSKSVSPKSSVQINLEHDFAPTATIQGALSTLPNVNIKAIAEDLLKNQGYGIYDSIASSHALLYLIKSNQPDKGREESSAYTQNTDENSVKFMYDNIDNMILESVDLLEGQISYDGMFSIGHTYNENLFYSLLSLDFLYEANSLGFGVNKNLLNKVHSFARDLNTDSLGIKALSFAVLSRYDRVNVANMRYIFESSKTDDVLYYIYMAKAFLNIADKDRAAQCATKAMSAYKDYIALIDRIYSNETGEKEIKQLYEKLNMYAPYPVASPCYIGYELLSVLNELDNSNGTRALVDMLSAHNLNPEFLSVTDKKALISAVTAKDAPFYEKTDVKGSNPYRIINNYTKKLFATVTARGLTLSEPKSYEHKLSVKKYHYDSNFKKLDLKQLKPIKTGDKIYVVIRAKPFTLCYGDLIIDEMLPAGFEFDYVDRYSAKIQKALSEHLSAASADVQMQKGDDRIQLKGDMGYSNELVYVYALRAVMPGIYKKGSTFAYMHKIPFIKAFVHDSDIFEIKQ